MPVQPQVMPVDGSVDVEVDVPAAAFFVPADSDHIDRRTTGTLELWLLTKALEFAGEVLRRRRRMACAAGTLLDRCSRISVQPYAQDHTADLLIKRFVCWNIIIDLGNEPVVA